MRTVHRTVSLSLLCLIFVVSVCEARKRFIPFGKRDAAARSSNSVPSGYETKLAYFSPTFDEVKSISKKDESVADIIDGYRTQFTQACSSRLNTTSASFANHTTFGWFTFSRDTAPGDVVNDGVIVVKVACYECSKYDVDGGDPGTPISEQTGIIIEMLKWDKETAASEGKDLIVQYDSYLQAQNTSVTANTTTTSSPTTSDNKTNDSSTNSSSSTTVDTSAVAAANKIGTANTKSGSTSSS